MIPTRLSLILLYVCIDALHAFTFQTTPSFSTNQQRSHVNNQHSHIHSYHNKYNPSKIYHINHSLTTTQLHSTRSSKEGGVTSTLISNLAIIALKLRLSSQTSVQCKVESSSRDILLRQSIGPVSVKGRDWSSPLGLTCKAIQADVETCMLDMNSVVTKRKLILLEPARGVAMIAFNNVDFGNFLIHPLLLQQAPKVSSGEKFEFVKDDVEIDNGNVGNVGNEENVIFYGECKGQRWKCTLKRGLENKRIKGGGRLADIQVIHQYQLDNGKNDSANGILAMEEGEIQALETELTMVLTNFFNELVFELDGTFLSYKDLKFHTTKKAPSETNIMFALDIMVKKFPSPGLAF